ncbi:MAG: AcrR family transcriptional regulator, partial [Paracoccaceae bacterium]
MTHQDNIINLAESPVANDPAAQSAVAASEADLSAVQKPKKYAHKKLLAIEAAAKVFAKKGFHGATTHDIAKEMGIQQGSLYYYFKS